MAGGLSTLRVSDRGAAVRGALRMAAGAVVEVEDEAAVAVAAFLGFGPTIEVEAVLSAARASSRAVL